MYKCSKCGMGAMVKDLPEPIRACKCTVKKERTPLGFTEKVKSFFGVKFYTERLAPIHCDMDAVTKGTSNLNA